LLFNSLIFTIFLPVVFAIYWLVPQKNRNYLLLLASWYFYFSYNPWFLLLLIGTTVVDYWCAQKIFHSTNKKLFLVLSIVSNLGVLAAFKYSAFFYNTAASLLNSGNSDNLWLMENLIIPAGLSFYTFQSLSYTIDVYRKKYEPSDKLYEFMLFVSFFPHMVAGPIVRYKSLMPQLKTLSYFKEINWGLVAQLCTWGYFKKMVIADNLSKMVDPLFAAPELFNGLELFIGGALFVVQVYCDFSGYSDIATGVARLFNIELSLNWRRPLLSKSLGEFWKRNHISITTWFRDYLYIGLGGNRVSYSRWLLNIFLVFVISGFWHGANLTFIIWGALHGVFFIGEIILGKLFPAYKAPVLFARMYLIGFHILSLIAFRANSVSDLGVFYKKIFSTQADYFNIQHLIQMNDLFFFILCLFFIAILILKELHEEYAIINKYPRFYPLAKQAVYLMMIVGIFVFGNFSAQTFIYFQF